LNEPWRIGIDDLSKAGAANVAVYSGWSEELRVFKGVESFQPELQQLRVRSLRLEHHCLGKSKAGRADAHRDSSNTSGFRN
jgi:hypothetical protein